MSEAFSLRDVKKTYKEFMLAIKELSLERGYVMGLVGRNGAGKSTTIKILMNLIYPDCGEVRVLGLKQPEQDMEIKRRVGYVSEEPVFYEEMTVGWMAGLVKRYYPTWDDALYQGYLRKFVMDPRKKVKELSRGMKVKLGLLLALSHRPELLIMDEPTSGIDPVVRHELLAEISEIIRDEERTVLFSSHITQDIEQIADYIGIIDQGKLVDCDDKESMLGRWRKVTGKAPVERGYKLDSIGPMFVELKRDADMFSGITRSFSEDWMAKLALKGATDLRVISMGLDEVLVSLAGEGEINRA